MVFTKSKFQFTFSKSAKQGCQFLNQHVLTNSNELDQASLDQNQAQPNIANVDNQQNLETQSDLRDKTMAPLLSNIENQDQITINETNDLGIFSLKTSIKTRHLIKNYSN